MACKIDDVDEHTASRLAERCPIQVVQFVCGASVPSTKKQVDMLVNKALSEDDLRCVEQHGDDHMRHGDVACLEAVRDWNAGMIRIVTLTNQAANTMDPALKLDYEVAAAKEKQQLHGCSQRLPKKHRVLISMQMQHYKDQAELHSFFDRGEHSKDLLCAAYISMVDKTEPVANMPEDIHEKLVRHVGHCRRMTNGDPYRCTLCEELIKASST